MEENAGTLLAVAWAYAPRKLMKKLMIGQKSMGGTERKVFPDPFQRKYGVLKCRVAKVVERGSTLDYIALLVKEGCMKNNAETKKK